MSNPGWITKACAALLFCVTAGIASPAQTTAPAPPPTFTFTLLYNFCSQPNCSDGEAPFAGLVQGTDGNLYGTTSAGGSLTGQCYPYSCGTVFAITPGGTLIMLHTFDGTDGSSPQAGLIQAADGNFYGTTVGGGSNSRGTVFKMTPSGALTTLYNFCSQGGEYCTDGDEPYAGLVQGVDKNFYGTTSSGGTNNRGTVFKVTASGALTTLYSFCSQSGCTDGEGPVAGLVLGTDGIFYGTASGGQHGDGVVFSITEGGTLTTLHNFDGSDGWGYIAGLVQGADGNLYGTTYYGGLHTYGTAFKITLGGALTTLYNFCSKTDCADGASPASALILGTDGNFYGTTEFGGIYNFCEFRCGTIFKITPDGLTTLYSFNGTDGEGPLSEALAQDTNGTLYGTTYFGGANVFYGTVFSLGVGLGPFVETNPAAGKVGATIGILGTNLTGATSVTFNGTQTAFRVASPSFLEAKVPSGATTGTVEVQLPGGALSSNVPFIVLR